MCRQLIGPVLIIAVASTLTAADPPPARRRSDPPIVRSSWDDLTDGVNGRADWQRRRNVLMRRYLELIRDDRKP